MLYIIEELMSLNALFPRLYCGLAFYSRFSDLCFGTGVEEC